MLKPCPFCGQQPKTWQNISKLLYKEGFNIVCCHIRISKVYKEEAVRVWDCRYKEK